MIMFVAISIHGKDIKRVVETYDLISERDFTDRVSKLKLKSWL